MLMKTTLLIYCFEFSSLSLLYFSTLSSYVSSDRRKITTCLVLVLLAYLTCWTFLCSGVDSSSQPEDQLYLHSLLNFRLEIVSTKPSVLQFRVCIGTQKGTAQIPGSTRVMRGNLLCVDVAKVLAAVSMRIVFVKRPHYARLERMKISACISVYISDCIYNCAYSCISVVLWLKTLLVPNAPHCLTMM